MTKSDAMHETEVKLYVPDLNAVARRVESAGGSLPAPRVLETNVRYDDAHGLLTASGAALRLRQDTRVRLTFKDPQRVMGEFSSTRFEAEVEVSDFATTEIILERLGYTPAWRYEKYRTTYTLDDCEIVLDETPIGNFIEIEGEDGAIGAVIRKLDLKDAPRFTISYSGLFKLVRTRLGLDMHDMTFADFAGVDVPYEVLTSNFLGTE